MTDDDPNTTHPVPVVRSLCRGCRKMVVMEGHECPGMGGEPPMPPPPGDLAVPSSGRTVHNAIMQERVIG